MTSIDITQLIAQVNKLEGKVTESISHLASKSDIESLSGKLETHLAEHTKNYNSLRKMWVVIFGSVVAIVAPQLAPQIFKLLSF